MTETAIEYQLARTADEEAAVAEFYRRMFPKSSRVVDLLEWRKREPLRSGGNSTMVARLNGEIVGAMNLVPVSLRVGSSVFKAVWQQDSMVSPSMRGRGVGRELINRSAADYEVLLAKGTNEGMYKLRKAAGFLDVANSNYLVRVLSPAAFGTDPKHVFYGIALGAMSMVQRRPQRGALGTKVLDSFGDEFDRLAHGARVAPEIRQVKDRTYLNWRYRDCPGREYRIVGAGNGDGVAGAAVLTVRKTAWIADLLCDNSDSATVVSLIRASIATCRASGAGSVRVFATSETARRYLKREGFVEVPQTPRFTYRPTTAGGDFEQAVKTGLDWNFSHGDGDIELYD
jgi:GNAT superfamily N-acetyltransferase